MIKFNKRDIVRVSNPSLKTYLNVGEVTFANASYVEVQFGNSKTLIYKPCNVELVGREGDCNYTKLDNEKENHMCVKGNYNVAMVNFVQGVNTTKKYAFALFDELVVGDFVLVDTSNGYSVATISEIFTKVDYEELGSPLPTREVICKIDFTAFDERKERRAKAIKLKHEMDEIVKSLQEIAVFELLAEKSPELKSMLDEYKLMVD